MRFGIGSTANIRWKKSAKSFGFIYERIRQIEAAALQKLRSCDNTKRLHPILMLQ